LFYWWVVIDGNISYQFVNKSRIQWVHVNLIFRYSMLFYSFRYNWSNLYTYKVLPGNRKTSFKFLLCGVQSFRREYLSLDLSIYCRSYFDSRFLTTSLVSSFFSWKKMHITVICLIIETLCVKFLCMFCFLCLRCVSCVQFYLCL
jgi:hypothetical protein